ncbi:unnamed protein product [Caenorhabditis auriculariae]|uniref:Glycerol kinase n=1 Tax=Caenorhabditis auriculariae TaxID=2777116 RepID=A0A8S1H1K5_9PELO|nr:unnamed protein product [Caenorhabditis auriculariae]
MDSKKGYIIGVDVGTTIIRAALFDGNGDLVVCHDDTVEPVVKSGERGEVLVEIIPDDLFNKFICVVKNSLEHVPLSAEVSLAIATQRNSIVVWEKANNHCRQFNSSFTFKVINACGFVLHAITRKARFLAARRLRMLPSMLSHRMIDMIDNSEELQSLLQKEDLAFGGLESWLIMRMSHKNEHVFETSSISSSGTFDPWIGDFNHFLLGIIGFPTKLLAPIRDTNFSDSPAKPKLDAKFCGREIPIHAMIADQQAATFGSGVWKPGDVKVSLGTGTFVDVVTEEAHASVTGFYPLVGWRLNGKSTFLAEGNAYDTSTILNWAQSVGFFDNVKETSSIAQSVANSNGTFFIPAFCGLQVPINDENACCGFIGFKPDTTRSHMIRALLESIVFRVFQIFNVAQNELTIDNDTAIRICGGVSQNDFICQAIADILERDVARSDEPRLTAAKGAAFIAGISLGYWKLEDLSPKLPIEKIFEPQGREVHENIKKTYSAWEKAVKRCERFYEQHLSNQ